MKGVCVCVEWDRSVCPCGARNRVLLPSPGSCTWRAGLSYHWRVRDIGVLWTEQLLMDADLLLEPEDHLRSCP